MGILSPSRPSGNDVPKVGQCMTSSLVPSMMKVVDCGSTDAVWEIIGNDGTLTERAFDEASEDLCGGFPGWENALWVGERTDDRSGNGEVVCLVQIGD